MDSNFTWKGWIPGHRMMQIWKGKSNEEGTKVMKQRKDGSLKEKKPQHLYLLLDDWSWGYSVRKIDLSFGDPDQQLTPHASVEPVRPNWHSLPSASFKFEAPRGYPNYFASAFDSKILAMQPMDSKFKNNSMDGILVYDVHMRSFIVGPQQRPVPVDPIYIPVGGRLFALAAGSFQMLHPPPCDDSDWKNFSWTWHALPDPPFLHQLVTSYAVHSDGRTIFVSIGGQAPATFSFDTAESEMKGRSRWKHDGHWKMPFNGRGYFAPELDAWVGLWGSLGRQTLRICAIDAVSGDLSLKMCEEELTCFATGGETIGATLVNMGGGSKFCLLESIYNDYNDGQAPRVGMRLTTFSLKYDKNGGLTMGKSRKVQHYSVPSEVTWSMLETLVAFCM